MEEAGAEMLPAELWERLVMPCLHPTEARAAGDVPAMADWLFHDEASQAVAVAQFEQPFARAAECQGVGFR